MLFASVARVSLSRQLRSTWRSSTGKAEVIKYFYNLCPLIFLFEFSDRSIHWLITVDGVTLSALDHLCHLSAVCAEVWHHIHGKSHTLQLGQSKKILQLVPDCVMLVHLDCIFHEKVSVCVGFRVEMRTRFAKTSWTCGPCITFHVLAFPVAKIEWDRWDNHLRALQKTKSNQFSSLLSSHCCRYGDLALAEVRRR